MASKNFKIPARNNMIPANSTHPAPRFSTSPASLYAVKFPGLISRHHHAAAGISQRATAAFPSAASRLFARIFPAVAAFFL
jgi:hypothetical protein